VIGRDHGGNAGTGFSIRLSSGSAIPLFSA
jgi:hypothetical protein